jgi:acetyl esterase/lipase
MVSHTEELTMLQLGELAKRIQTRLLAICLVLWIAVVSAKVQGQESVELKFASVDNLDLKLDLYQPIPKIESAELFPTIVWIHGGAWRAGSKSDVPILHLLGRGFVIASVEYRLSTQARFPAQIHDIKAAIRYLRANSKRLKLDPARFVIAGASAGGHLAALAGVSNDVPELEGSVGEYTKESSNVQAIVSFYGAANLNSILSQSTDHGLSVRVPALQLLLGGQPNEVPELAKLASPVTHVEAKDPPLWLIHGDADPQMPFEQSRELQGVYQQAGRPVKLDVISGGKHGGKEFFATQRLEKIAADLIEALSWPL